MDKVDQLNDLIIKELEIDHNDGGKKLTDILLFAEPLYKERVSQSLVKNGNNVEIPQNIVELGNNIIRLKRRLMAYGVSTEVYSKNK